MNTDIKYLIIMVFISCMMVPFSGCSTKNTNVEKPSFRIVSTIISKDLEDSENDSWPKNISHVFTPLDAEIVSHIRYENLSGRHYFRWEWMAPDGKQYYTTGNHPVQTSPHTYAREGTSWHKIKIHDALKKKGPGHWQVNIFFDDQLIAMDSFEITEQQEAFYFGNYHALVIGNNRYPHFKDLKTAEKDAKDIASVLSSLYGFKVDLLLNAKREDMILALNQIRSTLTGKDNLLIYYAGHGYLDVEGDEGYWLPVNARKENEINWLSNSYIATVLKATAARHVLIVSDSCYSGKLTREVKLSRIRLKDLTYYRNIAAKKSRCVLSSGGLEPVTDSGGKEGHSVFTSAFIDVLKENNGIMDMNTLFTKVRHMVMLNASQTPEYSDLRNAGHDGGEFLFIRK